MVSIWVIKHLRRIIFAVRKHAVSDSLKIIAFLALASLTINVHAQAPEDNPSAARASAKQNSKIRYIPAEFSMPAITDATRLLIKTRAGLARSELEKIIKPHKGRLLKRLAALDLNVVELPAASQAVVANALKRHPHIRFAEPDRKVRIAANDPYAPQQWHLAKVSAPQAWDIAYGEGIIVAVLDTGVYADHQDLAGKLVPGWNTYDNNGDTADVHGHGTWVSGVIAAITNNNLGVSSIAWGAKIMPIRIADPDGYAYYSDIVEGIIWAADHGARVANISFSGLYGSPAIHDAGEYMNTKGGVVVISAGNSGSYDSYGNSFPVIAVSATDSNDTLTGWSSYGNYVDVSAPGADILTTDNDAVDSYAYVSGTSFSSPITAAVVALMLSENPALQPIQLTNLLLSSATDLGDPGYDVHYGYGRVNAYAAVQAARNTLPKDTEAPSVSITSPISGTVAGIVAIDVAANDNVGVTKVELFVNGGVVATDVSAPYAFSWNTGGVPDGNASLQAYAYDAAGNFTVSQSVTLNVKNDVSNSANITFIDNFNTNGMDETQWKAGTPHMGAAAQDPQVTLTEQNGMLTITPISNISGMHHNGYMLNTTRDMTGGSVAVEVRQIAADYAHTILALAIDHKNWFRVITQGGRLYAQANFDGSGKTVANLVYSASQHRFWRMRHDAGLDQIIFETKAVDTGSVWTAQASVGRGATVITNMTAELSAGTYRAVAAPGTAVFDNFEISSRSANANPFFTDTFDAATMDAARWIKGAPHVGSAFDTQISVAQQSGMLNITPLTNAAGMHYAGYAWNIGRDMTGAASSVEVKQIASNSAHTVLALAIDRANWYRFITQDGRLYAQANVNGIGKALSTTVYSATEHRYWRIRHDAAADQIIFETLSANAGAAWVTRASTPRGSFAISNVKVELSAGTYKAVAVPGVARFDNFKAALP